jgi:hypothetical protein
VGVFDDEKGSKMAKIARKIKGTPASIDAVRDFANLPYIKKVC